MKIKDIETIHVQLPLVSPFQTSFGRFLVKDALLVRVTTDKVIGWGETASLSAPIYSADFTESDRIVQARFIFPQILGKEGAGIEDFLDSFKPIRGHSFAKAGVEMALWDALAKEANQPLWQYLGGNDRPVSSGISIGIMPSIEELVNAVGKAVSEGYQRIKIKIKPGWDVGPVAAIRQTFGSNIPLMVDANSAYGIEDISILKQLDRYGLLMIEQPLGYDDISQHSIVQRQLATPICLDESIHTLEDARFAVENGSCKIINIKPGRVGGLHNSKLIHDYCYAQGVPLWVGGMLETGIGRAHNIAVASLPGFTITGDISPSDRYWKEDITDPVIMKGGISSKESSGIGYEVDINAVGKVMVK